MLQHVFSRLSGDQHNPGMAAWRLCYGRKAVPARWRPWQLQVPHRLQVLCNEKSPDESALGRWPWQRASAVLSEGWRPQTVLVPAAVAATLLVAPLPHLGQPLAPSPTAAGEQQVAARGARKPAQEQHQPRYRFGSGTAPALTADTAAQPGREADGSDRPFVLDGPTASALAVSMVVAALANSAGVGGGAFIVPLMYLGLGFNIKDSTALSQAVIAGGALGSVASTACQQHPLDRCKPLIDCKLALIITPPLLLGCTTGVLYNQLLPGWGITFLIIPLLLYLTYRTGSTALLLYRAEAMHASLDRWLSPEERQQLETVAAEQQQQHQGQAEEEGGEVQHQREQPEGCPPPWQDGLQLLALWGVVLGFQLGKRSFSRCSWQFALLYFGQAATLLAASAFFIWQVIQEREKGCGCSAEPFPPPGAQQQGGAEKLYGGGGGDSSSWAPERLVSSAGVALVGGAVAGTLGIGGGMIVGPLMLELGIHPQVSAATASAMVLFSASSTAASFALEGRLNLEYSVAFGAACTVAAYLGVELVGRAVRTSGKSSLVVMLLAGIIGSGALLTVVCSGSDAVADLLTGHAAGMGSLCVPAA